MHAYCCGPGRRGVLALTVAPSGALPRAEELVVFARTTTIQFAWLWLRYQPDSALARWFRERVGNLQGRTRRIAIVAMARKLLIAIWRYVSSGIIPEGAQIAA